jgi:hypothetical protein
MKLWRSVGEITPRASSRLKMWLALSACSYAGSGYGLSRLSSFLQTFSQSLNQRCSTSVSACSKL